MRFQNQFTRLVFFLLLAFAAVTVSAQYYSGEHTFDGEHRNEVSASLTTGRNVITGPCIGNTLHYKHYFNDHWSVDGGANLQYTKELYGIKAKGEAEAARAARVNDPRMNSRACTCPVVRTAHASHL